jgi:cellulose synthase/poly-beta-1,6-N-acetylglucosamine synthase-like glycosyltransferase
MIFRRAILEQVADSLHTFVEDAELTLLLASRGILIEYAVETRVIDPKPNDSAGAMRQRARWLKGQTQLLRSYPLQIGRLLLAGPKGWSLLSSVLLKPKTLLTPLKALLVVMTWLFALTAGGPLLSLLAIAGAISLAADAGVYLYGLRYVNDRRATVRALLLAPLFLGLWMRSLAMSMMVGNGWLRVRPRQTRNSYTDRSASSFINTEPTPLVHPRRAEAYAPVIANKEWRVVSRSGVEAAGD